MNCNCKQELEAKLLEKLKAQHQNGSHHCVRLTGYGFTITADNKLNQTPCMEVAQSVTVPKKSGGHKQIKPKLSMFFSYCPFCGEKIGGEK